MAGFIGCGVNFPVVHGLQHICMVVITHLDQRTFPLLTATNWTKQLHLYG